MLCILNILLDRFIYISKCQGMDTANHQKQNKKDKPYIKYLEKHRLSLSKVFLDYNRTV
jgi:hypothetical protein